MIFFRILESHFIARSELQICAALKATWVAIIGDSNWAANTRKSSRDKCRAALLASLEAFSIFSFLLRKARRFKGWNGNKNMKREREKRRRFFIMAHGKINKIIICKFIIHIGGEERNAHEQRSADGVVFLSTHDTFGRDDGNRVNIFLII